MFIYPLKWKDSTIPNYKMNFNSEILSEKSDKVLKPFPNKEGNIVVWITVGGKDKMLRLDYLTIFTLGKYYDDIIRVSHIDDNKWNCNINNLLVLRKVDIIKKYKDLYNIENLDEIEEEWKIYPELPSIEVSNFGRIRNSVDKKLITPKEYHGYLLITVNNKLYQIHRMVATLFIENPDPDKYFYINHIDGNKSNNIFYNLEWCNISMNTEHAYLSGLFRKYNNEIIHNVCKLLEEGLSHKEISLITGVNRQYISDIYRGRRQKEISSHYEFKRRIPLDELYDKEILIALIKGGYKPKEISKLLKVECNGSFISYYERLKAEL